MQTLQMSPTSAPGAHHSGCFWSQAPFSRSGYPPPRCCENGWPTAHSFLLSPKSCPEQKGARTTAVLFPAPPPRTNDWWTRRQKRTSPWSQAGTKLCRAIHAPECLVGSGCSDLPSETQPWSSPAFFCSLTPSVPRAPESLSQTLLPRYPTSDTTQRSNAIKRTSGKM